MMDDMPAKAGMAAAPAMADFAAPPGAEDDEARRRRMMIQMLAGGAPQRGGVNWGGLGAALGALGQGAFAPTGGAEVLGAVGPMKPGY